MTKNWMMWIRYTMIALVTLACAAGVITCFYIGWNRTLTATESLMLGLILSFLSIFTSWLVTHVYSELSYESATEEAKRAYNENIVTFARKAAEKLLNLSNELSRLAASLKGALEDYGEDETSKTTIITLKERIGSSIHIIETLKSMNDTSLSDWRGVIGDEIQKQEALQLQIDNLACEVENQKKLKQELEENMVAPEEVEKLQKHIESMETRLSQKVVELPFNFRPWTINKKKQHFPCTCPSCGEAKLAYLEAVPGAKRTFTCKKCKQQVKVILGPDGKTTAEVLPELDESGECPVCKVRNNVKLSQMLGRSVSRNCEGCGTSLFFVRASEGLRLMVTAVDLSERILEMVEAKIPPRPWPQETVKKISEELHFSGKTVERSIDALIASGRISQKPGPGMVPAISPSGSNGHDKEMTS